jgi:hypothetical protein
VPDSGPTRANERPGYAPKRSLTAALGLDVMACLLDAATLDLSIVYRRSASVSEMAPDDVRFPSRDPGFHTAGLCQPEGALSVLNLGNGYAEFVGERENLNVHIVGKGTRGLPLGERAAGIPGSRLGLTTWGLSPLLGVRQGPLSSGISKDGSNGT